ncbi:type 11 methyltransferase [Rubrivivax benzoatilyticus JA2 = ATCC BAA-35]|uniref:class I SAM-dependent methyltransferase n=1 Tax=Rubrivivax benzoatilyticus TaxID=316997 RepID=UPI00020A46A5|nr:class I SAM-dependent methyltransferase [Rubrivivax benzoatilyticus]EGJ09960.1 type 11 methyltransferase [Rubrivivax benzoatilyticus JA2 = ATCC BAA-35]
MSTDIEWEKWGARDPYFSVLTDPRFRVNAMTAQAREDFFALGRMHVDHVLHVIRCHLDGAFAPTRTLDFGCGVGRLVMPFARLGGEVVGVDISPSMLAEARRNCDQAGLSNVVLLPSDDALSAVAGDFDLVHSCIVLQHIEIPRGLVIFEQLVRRVRPGGMGGDPHHLRLGRPCGDAGRAACAAGAAGAIPPGPGTALAARVGAWKTHEAGRGLAAGRYRPGDADELLQRKPAPVHPAARRRRRRLQ